MLSSANLSGATETGAGAGAADGAWFDQDEKVKNVGKSGSADYYELHISLNI
jgi:hypothetical protein